MWTKYGVKTICWCTDNGPDGKKFRRLLFEWLFWMVITVCWAHQMNLIVGDLLSANKDYAETISTALAMITWFNNHGEPLAWLQAEQKHVFDGKSWILFLPVLTRWLAHYHSLSRFIQLKPAIVTLWTRKEDDIIQKAGRDQKSKDTARRILAPIGDKEFWSKLETCVLQSNPVLKCTLTGIAAYGTFWSRLLSRTTSLKETALDLTMSVSHSVTFTVYTLTHLFHPMRPIQSSEVLRSDGRPRIR